MAILTDIPSSSTQLQEEPLVRKLQFGRQYSQRAGDGINSIAEKWAVVFSVRSNVDTVALLDFFRARAGHESFDWTPPGGSLGKYIATKWSRGFNTALDMNTVNVLIERVYEA